MINDFGDSFTPDFVSFIDFEYCTQEEITEISTFSTERIDSILEKAGVLSRLAQADTVALPREIRPTRVIAERRIDVRLIASIAGTVAIAFAACFSSLHQSEEFSTSQEYIMSAMHPSNDNFGPAHTSNAQLYPAVVYDSLSSQRHFINNPLHMDVSLASESSLIVPEPSSVALMAVGAAGLSLALLRRRSKGA